MVGLRVVIAARYSHDVWARDETGGRDGTIVSILESAPDSHSTALVKKAGGGDKHQGKNRDACSLVSLLFGGVRTSVSFL